MKPQDLRVNVDIGAIVQSAEGPSARISNATYSRLWGLAAEAVNAIKADGLDDAATAIRARADETDVDGLRTAAQILDELAGDLRTEGDTQ